MKINEWFRKQLQQYLQVDKLVQLEELDPVKKKFLIDKSNSHYDAKVQTNFVWYQADSELLLYFYGYIMKEKPEINNLVTPNFKNYFWYKSSKIRDMKRTHSGIARVIVNTLVNCCGSPMIEIENNPVVKKRLLEILDKNNFDSLLQNQMELTLALGDGAYFINIDSALADCPIIEWIDARNCQFEFVGNMITAVVKKTFYDYKMEQYVCYEKRSVGKIEYQLYKIVGEILQAVPLDTIEETKNLIDLKLNFNVMLAVPIIHKMDNETKRGASVFTGKVDLFDDFDQNLTQEASIMQAITPVENIDLNSLDVDEKGKRILPNVYGKKYNFYQSNKSYGDQPNPPQTTFNDIDFTKISTESLETLMRICTGIVSPATLGFDVARNSSDLAQREKEKITLHTVKNITDYESKAIQRLCSIVLIADDLMRENVVPKKYDFNVRFPEYANPSFENKLSTLSPVFASGGLSAEMYVEKLWGDTLSEEQKKKEVERLNESKEYNPFSME